MDFSQMRLGRLPSQRDNRTLQLANYFPTGLPFAPIQRRWEHQVPAFSLGGNDRYGDCVIVCAANEILLMRANTTVNDSPIKDSEIIKLAEKMRALHGYNILNRLNYWRKNGMWKDKLLAFAQFNSADPEITKSVINLFAVADIGVNLPNAWKNSDIWDTGNGRQYDPGTWGGHSVPIVGYDKKLFYVATWGHVMPMTPAALEKYVDESYALIDLNWFNSNNMTPSGFDLPALQADLKVIDAG